MESQETHSSKRNSSEEFVSNGTDQSEIPKASTSIIGQHSDKERRNNLADGEERKIHFSESRRVAYRTHHDDRDRHKSGKEHYYSSSREDSRSNRMTSERNSKYADDQLSNHRDPKDDRFTNDEIKSDKEHYYSSRREDSRNRVTSDRNSKYSNDKALHRYGSKDDRRENEVTKSDKGHHREDSRSNHMIAERNRKYAADNSLNHLDSKDSRLASEEIKSSNKNHSSDEKNSFNGKEIDARITYVDNFKANDKSNCRSPSKTDYHNQKPNASRSPNSDYHYHKTTGSTSSKIVNNYHGHKPEKVDSFQSYDGNKHCDETYLKNSYNSPDKGSRYPKRSYNENESYSSRDERHISFRNPSSGDEEFVASLLQKIDFFSEQVDHLTQENEKLKYSSHYQEEPTAEVSIKFGNKRFEEKFLSILKELATDLITGRCSVESLSSFLKNLDGSHLQSDSWIIEGELFSLDHSCDEPKENTSVPRYNHSFNEALQKGDVLLDDTKKKSNSSSKVCFNCDGDHFINKCPHPINRKKIANARRKTRTNFLSNKRYHVFENQQSGFKPGVISDELRKALNLQSHQIPSYIYKMRVLDYPPGWLAEAAIESSGILLYGSEGVVQPEEKNKEAIEENKVPYDPDKLIDYPGFNVPLPPDLIDESSAMGLPPLQNFQLRVFAEENMVKPELPSRKRKLDLPESQSSKAVRLDESMDIDEETDPVLIDLTEEFCPPLPEDVLPPPPPDDDCEVLESASSESQACATILNNDLNTISIIEPFKLNGNLSPSSGTASPSLRELEEMKKRLVMELGITSNSSSAVSNDLDPELVKTDLLEKFTAVDNQNESSNLSDDSFSPKASSSGMVRQDSLGSKLVVLGTPSITRHSSFNQLPKYENFSKNVTSHLNFENLPNSTGTYERMKKVIKKVKHKLSSMIQ